MMTISDYENVYIYAFLSFVNGLLVVHFSSYLMTDNKMNTFAEDCLLV